jgi:hypothetical protein
MFGLSVLAPQAIYVAVALFITGLLSMLCSTVSAMLELIASLEPVELESEFVTAVLHDSERQDESADEA